MLLLVGCSQSTSQSFNGALVSGSSASTESENGGTTGGNPMIIDSSDPQADPSDFWICLAPQVVLTNSNGIPVTSLSATLGLMPFDLKTGRSQLTLSGSVDGTYQGLQLLLSADCFNNNKSSSLAQSVSVTNSSGTFFTGQQISWMFLGKFEVIGGTATLTLDASTALGALAGVTSGADLPATLQSNAGTISQGITATESLGPR